MHELPGKRGGYSRLFSYRKQKQRPLTVFDKNCLVIDNWKLTRLWSRGFDKIKFALWLTFVGWSRTLKSLERLSHDNFDCLFRFSKIFYPAQVLLLQGLAETGFSCKANVIKDSCVSKIARNVYWSFYAREVFGVCVCAVAVRISNRWMYLNKHWKHKSGTLHYFWYYCFDHMFCSNIPPTHHKLLHTFKNPNFNLRIVVNGFTFS